MQSATRLRLCLFSFEEKQNNDDYQDKKSLLEQCSTACESILTLKNGNNSNPLVIAHIPYDTRNNIHLCIVGYKGHIFYGFFNAETGKISFEDNKSQVITLKNNYIIKLEERFTNEINNPTHISDDRIQSGWKNVLPLLDEVIELEDNIKNAPENVRKRMLQHYDEQLDILVKTFENNNLENSQITIENYTR